MKYLLLILHDEQGWENRSEVEREQIFAEFRQLREELRSSGRFVDGARLQPTASAVRVRLREGGRLATDGPFAETREQLAGYFLVETDSREEALDIAARVPAARWGTIEVRELVEVPAVAPATT